MDQTAQGKTWTWKGRLNLIPSFQSTNLYCFSEHAQGCGMGPLERSMVVGDVLQLSVAEKVEGRQGSKGP